MKQEPTKEQVLDALQTHKTVQKAAKALGLSYPEMQKCLRPYGILVGHIARINNPKAMILITPARGFGQSTIAVWFRKKFKKGE